MGKYIGNRIVPRHDGVWDSTKAYEPLTIVLDTADGNSYISRRPVPAGTVIGDTTFWMLYSLYSQQVADAERHLAETAEEVERRIAASEEKMEKGLTATEEKVAGKLAETENSVDQRAAAAEGVSNRNKTELNKRMDGIDARLDSNVSASTDADADYAAEVVDARTDIKGRTHGSAGGAMRDQLSWTPMAWYVINSDNMEEVCGSDLDNLSGNRFYQVYLSEECGCANLPPVTMSGLFITYRVVNTVAEGIVWNHQLYFGYDGQSYFRIQVYSSAGPGTVWSGWHKLLGGSEMASIEDSLSQSLMRGRVTEALAASDYGNLADNLPTNRIYWINRKWFTDIGLGDTLDGVPVSEIGHYFEFGQRQESTLRTQIFFIDNNKHIFHRQHVGDSYTEWRQLAGDMRDSVRFYPAASSESYFKEQFGGLTANLPMNMFYAIKKEWADDIGDDFPIDTTSSILIGKFGNYAAGTNGGFQVALCCNYGIACRQISYDSGEYTYHKWFTVCETDRLQLPPGFEASIQGLTFIRNAVDMGAGGIETGGYRTGGDRFVESADYCESDYIPIVKGETVFSYGSDLTKCFYNAEKAYLYAEGDPMHTVTDGRVRFFRVPITAAQYAKGYCPVFVTNGSKRPSRNVPFKENILISAHGADRLGDTVWNGKIWYCYGTSMTDSTVDTESTQTGYYAPWLAKFAGLKLHDRGKGGSGIIPSLHGGASADHIKSRVMTLDDGKAAADLITVEVIPNDMNGVLGELTDTGDDTFLGNLGQIIQYLQEKTSAQIVILAATRSRYNVGGSLASHHTPEAQATRLAWENAVAEKCKLYGVQFWNGAAESGLGLYRCISGNKYVSDQIHLTSLGGYNLARYYYSRLKELPLFYTEAGDYFEE